MIEFSLLPLLLKGWNIEDAFEQKAPTGLPLGTSVQPLMVLKKI